MKLVAEVPCFNCLGTGKLQTQFMFPTGPKCHHCNGKGKVHCPIKLLMGVINYDK